MKSYLVGATSTAPSSSATNYNSIQSAGTGSWNATEVLRASVIPHALTLDRLRVNLTTAPGAGKNWVFTVMKNGSATALTVTIADTNTQAMGLALPISFAAGDTISLRAVPTGTPTATGVMNWHCRQNAASLFAIVGQNVGTTTSGTNYMFPFGRALIASTIALGNMIVPCAGTVSNLYLWLRTAPAGTGSYAVTLYKNGVATALTATLGSADTAKNDTTHSVSVAAGDLLTLEVIATNTPVSTTMGYSMSFAPTTDGDSFLAYQANGSSPSTSATNYQQPVGDGVASWNATEANRTLRIGRTVVKGIFAETSVSPGVSPKNYTFRVRVEAADTAALILINDASTTVGSTRVGNLTGQSIAVLDNGRINFKSVPSGTPVAVFAKLSALINTPDNVLAETLTDNFDDNSLDGAKWESGTVGAGSTFSESSQQINEAPAASVTGAESYMPGVGFNPIYDLTGSYFHANLKQALNADANAYTWFNAIPDNFNNLFFAINGSPRLIIARTTIAGVDADVASATYDATAHAWVRIREGGGQIYWETSPDGTPGNWSILGQLATPFIVTDMYPKLNAYADGVATPGTAIWDNFNIIPAYNTAATRLLAAGRQLRQAINRSNVF